MSRAKLIRNTAAAYRTILEEDYGCLMVSMDTWREADVSYIFEEFLKNGILIEKHGKGRYYMHLNKSKADPDKTAAYFRDKGKPDPNAEMAAFLRSRANFYRGHL